MQRMVTGTVEVQAEMMILPARGLVLSPTGPLNLPRTIEDSTHSFVDGDKRTVLKLADVLFSYTLRTPCVLDIGLKIRTIPRRWESVAREFFHMILSIARPISQRPEELDTHETVRWFSCHFKCRSLNSCTSPTSEYSGLWVGFFPISV